MTNTEPMLRATGLRKAYGQGRARTEALANVDLELAPGELVAIMGPSGSGKTTLLHGLAGLERVDSGSIRIAGEDLAQVTDRALTKLRNARFGVIFQAYNLLPSLTALDNVALPLMLAGRGRTAARSSARSRLADVGLESLAQRRPAELSGGEQQRVAVARALVNDPQVVLADEPTGNLDRRSAEVICRLLREVVADGRRAVAVVTHDPLVAFAADRVVVLADGRVVDRFSREAVASAEALAVRCLHSERAA